MFVQFWRMNLYPCKIIIENKKYIIETNETPRLLHFKF